MLAIVVVDRIPIGSALSSHWYFSFNFCQNVSNVVYRKH